MNDETLLKIMYSITGVFIILTAVIWTSVLFIDDARAAFYAPKERQLSAMLKGSIYETSEYMSVFGTCLDTNDMPVDGSYANFSAWYPNGTLYLENMSMTEISTGYFLWNGYMPIAEGTYLTQMECTGLNQTAKAFGEWQNPLWVSRIAVIANLTNNTYMLLQDVNGAVYGISANMSTISNMIISINESLGNLSVIQNFSEILSALSVGFNISYSYMENLSSQMNANFTYTNSLISSVNSSFSGIVNVSLTSLQNNITGSIANTNQIINQSFNTNTTLISALLYQILNATTFNRYSNLTWVEDYGAVRFNQYWNIKVYVYDVNNRTVSSPDVACTINTTSTPLEYMDIDGNHFNARILVEDWDFAWTTNCFAT